MKIGIAGFQGVGKTTFGAFLRASLFSWKNDINALVMPFAGPMKDFLAQSFDCDPFSPAGKQERVDAAGMTCRQLMQALGAAVRHELPDFWVWAWKHKTAAIAEEQWVRRVIFIADDVRYENEAREMDLIFHVMRPGFEAGEHESEKLNWLKSGESMLYFRDKGRREVIAIETGTLDNNGSLRDLERLADVYARQILKVIKERS